MPDDERDDWILPTHGSVPHGLSGRFLCLEPNRSSGPTIHSVVLHGGTASSYRHRLINTHPAGRAPTTNLIHFAGRTLALADGAMVQEVTTDLGTTSVDTAGHGRGVGAYPKTDVTTGELHLLSNPGEPAALHHVISAGALTRRSNPIADPPSPVLDLAITERNLVVFADGFTGVVDLTHCDPIAWLPTGLDRSGRITDAHDADRDVIVHLGGEGLEEWTLTAAAGRARRRVLDATRQRPARFNKRSMSAPPRYLYAIGGDRGTDFAGETLFKHDLLTGTREDHTFGQGRQAGDFVFAADPERHLLEDGGWILGLVHDQASGHTRLHVLDAADAAGPALARVDLPRRIPHSPRCLWTPSPTDHRSIHEA